MVPKKSLILVLLFFSVFGCSFEKLSLNGNVTSAIDGEPKSNVKVYIFEEKNSVYGLFRYPIFDSSITNTKGIFKFRTEGKGKYIFDFYKDHVLQYHSETIEIKESKDSLKLKFTW